MKNILALIVLVYCLGACAFTNKMSPEERNSEYEKYIVSEKLIDKETVRGFKFDSWSSLSDNYVIIRAVHNKNYLIETAKRCFGLSMSSEIRINRSTNLSLRKNQDSISTAKDGHRKCVIKSIFPITNGQRNYLVNIGKIGKSER